MRQRTNTPDVGEVPDEPQDIARPSAAPSPKRTWLRSTKVSWKRFWASPGRHITVESLDMDPLERLWTLYDERTRAQLELSKARVVEGSQGQMRPSGFYTVISRLDTEIRHLEAGIGKGAKARLALGMAVGRADRPDEAEEPAEPRRAAAGAVDDGYPSQDPRLYVVERDAG